MIRVKTKMYKKDLPYEKPLHDEGAGDSDDDFLDSSDKSGTDFSNYKEILMMKKMMTGQ
jgi:hypothetical protein